MMTHGAFHFSGKKGSAHLHRGGFTLLEVLLASTMGAMILAAVYLAFSGATRLRDQATERAHNAQLRERAAKVIRNDLLNAYVSGGNLAASLQGNAFGPEQRFPGYLKFTTTTGKDTDDELRGDVQEISYYVVNDPDDPTGSAGMLVRAVNRTLLARTRDTGHEEQLLTGVTGMEVSFWDGSNWSNTWTYTPGSTKTSGTTGGTSTTSSSLSTSGTNSNNNAGLLPEAVRVHIDQVASSKKVPAPPPLEILVPWTAQLVASGTTSTSGTTATTTTAAGSGMVETGSEDEELVPPEQEGVMAGTSTNVGDEDSEEESQSTGQTGGATP